MIQFIPFISWLAAIRAAVTMEIFWAGDVGPRAGAALGAWVPRGAVSSGVPRDDDRERDRVLATSAGRTNPMPSRGLKRDCLRDRVVN